MNYYILFDNYTQGFALLDLLRGEGLRARVAPTPRDIDGAQPCGMSLLVAPEQIDAVRSCIARHGAAHRGIAEVPCQIHPERDRFC